MDQTQKRKVDLYTGKRGAVVDVWRGSIELDSADDFYATLGSLLLWEGDEPMVMADWLARVDALTGDSDAHPVADGWPWEYATSADTWRTLSYVDAAVHVFEHGYLIATHYVNGGRRQSVFPQMRHHRPEYEAKR